MNPIIQTMMGSSTAMAQARQMAQMIKTQGNPQAMVSQMVARNPRVNQIINQYGGDPKTAFYKYAEANGIDPNEILNMLK